MARDDDEVARRVLGQRAYGSIYGAQYADAMKSARTNEVAKSLGMPTDIVDADMPNMLAAERLQKRMREIERNAAYAKIMAVPDFAKAAIDDDHLPKVAEKAGNAVRESAAPTFSALRAKYGLLGGTARAGAYILQAAGSQVGVGIAGVARAAVEFDPTNIVTSLITGKAPTELGLVDRVSDYYTKAGEQSRVQYSNWVVNEAVRGLESVPQSIIALAGAATNPATSIGLLSTLSAGGAYDTGRREGLSPVQSLNYAATQGFAEAAGESIPILKWAGDAMAGAGFGKRLAGQLVTENIGEQLTGHLQDFSTWAMIDANKGKSFGDFLKERPEAAVSIAIATTAATGAQTAGAYGLERAVDKLANRGRDQRNIAAIDSVMTAAQQSSVRAANPSGFAEAMNQLVEGTGAENIYVDARQVQSLFQSEDGTGDMAEDPFWSQYAAQVEEAAAIGGDVIIPVAQAATSMDPSQWNALRNHAKASPKGMSITEAKNKQSPEELEKLAAEVEKGLTINGRAAITRQALGIVGSFGKQLGYSGERGKLINRVLAAGLANIHQREMQRRVAAGLPVIPMEEFAKGWLPQAAKATQREFDKAAREVVAPRAPRERVPDLIAYIRDGKGSLKAPAVAKALGVSEAEARDLLGVTAGMGAVKDMVRVGPDGSLRRVARPKGPVDVIQFVRMMGGIKDSEGHNLSKGRDYRRQPGLINNKAGKTIDEIGEMLHEAGYFNPAGPRPTTAEVLDLLERGFTGKVYRAEDEAEIAEQGQAEQEAQARALLGDAMQETGIILEGADYDMALGFMAEEGDPLDAISRAVAEIEYQIRNELVDESEKGYEDADGEIADALASQREMAGNLDEGVPGFDDFAGPTLTSEERAAQSDDYFPGDQTLNQSDNLFDDPDQPYRTMTQAQRAEMMARLQQSMMRRGGQESVKDQEGGLFSSERDQDTLFQRQQTQTPEFAAWFGDSKVVDDNGEPLVVYHGTVADVEQFDEARRGENTSAESAGMGFFFTDDTRTAESYAHYAATDAKIAALLREAEEAERRGDWDAYDAKVVEYEALDASFADSEARLDGQNVLPVYLAIENPLRVDAAGENAVGFDIPNAIRQAVQGGHDGLIIENLDDAAGLTDRPATHFIVFKPEQIKSATGNRGTFDPRDPNILNDTVRGSITITRDEAGFMSAALIRAFETANFSTAVHELGHFFLEDLRRRALSEGATDQERADWETFKAWAFDTSGLLVSDTDLIPVEAHEYFARGFERYAYEGQAPSKGLRALFAKMREFMLELYRAATAFNAPITPEIREVMARMLASDEEVADQAQEMKLAAVAMGDLLTEQEKAQHGLLADEAREEAKAGLFERVLSALKAERSAEVRERKREIKAEVEAEVDGQPIFTALRLLRGGARDTEGEPVKMRLSRQWLVDTYGEGILTQMPKGVPPLYGEDDTVDADQLAEMAGYASGDAMIREMVAQEADRLAAREGGDKRSPRNRLIDEMVSERLRAEMGDPFENLEDEAAAALANDKQAELLSLELRAVARRRTRSGKPPTPWEESVSWARQHIAKQSSSEALSGRALQMYARNAAKAGQAVEEALIAKDYDEAFAAKQRQLLNLALLQEARKAKKDVDAAVRRMQRIATRDTIPTVDQDYLDQAHQLLESVDMRDRPQSQIDRRLQFEAWHSAQVAMGLEPVVPPEYRAILGTTPYSRLAIDELLELDLAVKQVIELGRLKKKLRDRQEEREYEAVVAEMEAVADEQLDRAKGPTTDERKSVIGWLRSRLRSIDSGMLTAERVMGWMDGNRKDGPWTRYIYGIMSDAQGNERDLMRDYIERINSLIRGLDPKLVRGWDRKVDTPELIIRTAEHSRSGEAWQGTKDQIVMMAMNWGNEGNRQRLLDGFGWREEAMQAVLDRHMTQADWQFVQQVWDIVDTLWPAIEELERRVNGVAPEKVEATEIVTPFGTYRGGYFPAVYDPNESSAAALNDEDKKSPHGGWHNTTVRSSASKARASLVRGRPLLLSMDVITRHMGEVIHDVTHREAIHQVKKLLTDKRVRSALNKKMGPEYASALGAWVDNIAQPGIAYSKAAPFSVFIGRYLHKAISLVGLGFRISTVFVQPLGSLTAIGEVGSKAIGHGYRVFLSNPAKAMREIHAKSAFMRARADNFDASVEQIRQAAAGGLLKKIGVPTPVITEIGERGLSKYAFQGIAYADMMVSGSAWIGAYDKATAEGLDDDAAVEYADGVVRKTQGAGGGADTSLLMNQHPIIRSFYPFFSYLNALYGMQRDIGRRAGVAVTKGARGDYRGFTRDTLEVYRRFWWVAVAPVIANAILFGEGPDEEEDWGAWLTKELILGNLASIPGIGSIANAMGSGYGYRSTAIQQVGEGIIDAKDDVAKMIEEGEDYELTGSVIKRTLTTIGLVTAQPLGQIGATTGGAYDYATGEAEPEDAGDVYELVTKGKVSDGPRPVERALGETE